MLHEAQQNLFSIHIFALSAKKLGVSFETVLVSNAIFPGPRLDYWEHKFTLGPNR